MAAGKKWKIGISASPERNAWRMSPTQPTVYIIDDDDSVRCALEMLMGSVGLHAQSYASAPHFLAAYQPTKAGCMLVDVRLPGMSGLELQAHLHDRAIDLPVIMISGHGDVTSAVRAMKAGAVDYIQKPFNSQVLLETVQRAIERSVANARAQAEADKIRKLLASLTAREQDVLEGVLAGEPNKRIAARLRIAEKTVEAHRARLMAKLEVKNVVELLKTVLAAAQKGNPSNRAGSPP
jgi:two-component system response regulator FixJ